MPLRRGKVQRPNLGNLKLSPASSVPRHHAGLVEPDVLRAVRPAVARVDLEEARALGLRVSGLVGRKVEARARRGGAAALVRLGQRERRELREVVAPEVAADGRPMVGLKNKFLKSSASLNQCAQLLKKIQSRHKMKRC